LYLHSEEISLTLRWTDVELGWMFMFSWTGILLPSAVLFYLWILISFHLEEWRFPASLERGRSVLFDFSGLFLVLLKCKAMVDPLFYFTFNKSEYYDATISMGPAKMQTMLFLNFSGWVITLIGISIVKNYLSS
jgi:hypothetical protein